MIIPSFKGINNRLSDTALPMPSREDARLPLRNAVNVDIDNAGNIVMPGWGTVKRYTATDTHSWYEFQDGLGYGLFVDDGNLKRLNLDYTATVLKAVQNIPMSYAVLNDKVFFSNGIDCGIYDNLGIAEWGITNPPRQPDPTSTTTGGMYAGDYRVAITWMTGSGTHFQESGTFNSTRVTVTDGGGIRLTNFPTPPDYVDQIAVYVSAVNSQDLYLYDEYPASTSEVFIRYNVGTVKLQTQFATKPEPGLCLTVHNGGLFWFKDNLIGYTEPHAPYLYRAGNFFDMEDEVLAIVSIKTGPLYAQTTKGLYAINSIYNPEVPAQPTKIRVYGGCKLYNVAYHPDNNEACIWTDAGFTRITGEGIQDLNANEFASPHFSVGAIAYVESNGISKVVFVGKDGTKNALQYPEYSAMETIRIGREF